MRPLKLVFHPKETCFPIALCFRTSQQSKGGERVYLPANKTYYAAAETYQFVYKENPAIGLCGMFPRSPCLGYHCGDIERITYFYSDGDCKKLECVLLSAHSVEHQLLYVPDGTEDDSPITVYVAKGSHAFYASAGIHWRILGFANDLCADGGQTRIYSELDVQELTEPTAVEDLGIAVAPTILTADRVLTAWQRFWIPK
jgi:hypothetical protein